MKKVIFTVAMALALIGGLAVWLHAPPARQIDPKPLEVSPEKGPLSPSPEVVSGSSPQSSLPSNPTTVKPNVLDRLNVAPNSIGSTTNPGSFNFAWYVLIASVISFEERNDTQMRSSFQEMYELSDEELKSVLEYARTAVSSDRDFQADERLRLCMRRAEFQNVDALGRALNESDRRVEENQEHLGRQAERALSASALWKINSQLAKRPLGDITVADYPALFAAKHSDLGEEIARICGNVP
jgi:hypothetical protein